MVCDAVLDVSRPLHRNRHGTVTVEKECIVPTAPIPGKFTAITADVSVCSVPGTASRASCGRIGTGEQRIRKWTGFRY